MSDVHIYQITFQADQKTVEPSGKITVKLEFDGGLSLGLGEYAQGEAALFSLGDSGADKMSSLKLNASRKVNSAEGSGKGIALIGIAGIQNRENDGDTITLSGLEDGLGDALEYAVMAGTYSGTDKENVAASNLLEAAGAEENAEDTEQPDVERILEKVSDYSLILANGKSSSHVKVINLYADGKGQIDDEPLQEILSDDQIDVSDTTVVINVVAESADQSLKLPVYPVKYQNETIKGNEEKESYAGRVIYNIVAV